jgi:hypothetical protein
MVVMKPGFNVRNTRCRCLPPFGCLHAGGAAGRVAQPAPPPDKARAMARASSARV